MSYRAGPWALSHISPYHRKFLKKLSCYHDNNFGYFMFGKYNGFVSKARVSACMYFLVVSIYSLGPSECTSVSSLF
jgi:hypothetical protein